MRMRSLYVAVALWLVAVAYPAGVSAGTVTNSINTFDYQAAPGETNHLLIDGTPFNGYRVRDTGAPVIAGAGCVSVTANEATCPGANFVPDPRVMTVALGDMDDFLRIKGGTDTMRIDGGEGADDLRGGLEGVNYLDGGPGPDVFMSSAFFRDFIDYSQRSNPVKATVGDGLANDGEAGEGDLILGSMGVLGGHADDKLMVTAASERGVGLLGGGGDDRLTARHSSSFLSGGPGDDTLINDASGDFVFLYGDGGNDILQGGARKDRMHAGGGNDALFGEGSRDVLVGGVGADLLVGGPGHDWMSAGAGRDILRARDGGRDRLKGGLDFDRARVDMAIDQLSEVELLF